MVTYDRLSPRFLTLSTGITRDGRKDIRVILDLDTNFFYTLDDDDNFQKINQEDGYNFINKKDDFPSPSNGIITLEDNITYFITSTIDLEGDRIVCGENTCLIGGSSENCRIKSTGLLNTSLITSNYSRCIKDVFNKPVD